MRDLIAVTEIQLTLVLGVAGNPVLGVLPILPVSKTIKTESRFRARSEEEEDELIALGAARPAVAGDPKSDVIYVEAPAKPETKASAKAPAKAAAKTETKPADGTTTETKPADGTTTTTNPADGTTTATTTTTTTADGTKPADGSELV